MTRTLGSTLTGLGLLGALALLTVQAQEPWRDSLALWSSAEHIASTIRVHVNRREAELFYGDPMNAIDECKWLLGAVRAGKTTRRETADIGGMCFEAQP